MHTHACELHIPMHTDACELHMRCNVYRTIRLCAKRQERKCEQRERITLFVESVRFLLDRPLDEILWGINSSRY